MASVWTVLVLAGMIGTVHSVFPVDCPVENSFYNVTSKSCQCEDGFDGAGDLCCSQDNDKDVCFVTGDPFLRSVYGQQVAVSMPCSICINVMNGVTERPKQRRCVWEVLASSTIEDNGAIYLSSIKVGVKVSKQEPRWFSFTGDTFVNELNNKQTNRKKMANKGGSITANLPETSDKLAISHDPDNDLWSIEGCGNKVSFRPKTENIQGKPGVCMQAVKGTTDATVQMGNLCGLKPSFDKSIPWPYGVLNSALTTRYTMFSPEQLESLPEYNDVCKDELDKSMKGCPAESGQAIEKCGPLLYNSVIRLCLSSGGVGGPDLLSLFRFCLDAYCQGSDGGWCTKFQDNVANKGLKALQVCVPSLTNCETWPNSG